MAQMYDLKKNLFVGFENVRGFFFYEIAPVHEIEHPFRVCDKALFIHILPGKAIVAGRWKYSDDDLEKHLLAAMRGRTYVQEEEDI